MTVLWGADANILGWQNSDVGGSGTSGASLAAVRSYLIATYLPGGLGPYGKFFDGGSGWHATYSSFATSGYGVAANERHPVICAKAHTTSSFNTLMTDMAAALPPGETWYACFYSEPEAGFNAGTLTHSGYQATWAEMNTLRAAHPHGAQVKFIPILMAFQEISGTQHWSSFLTPVLAYADAIGWDVYDDNGDSQSWSFETDIYPAIQALQAASGLPWSIPEYGLQVSSRSGSTDSAAGVRARWQAMVAVCDADPNCLWGNYWMDGPHAPNQRSAVIRTDSASAAYLTLLVAVGGGGSPDLDPGLLASVDADSSFSLDLTAGDVVYLRVGTATVGAAAPFTLSWSTDVGTPPNDDRADAYVLAGANGGIAYYTAGGSSEVGEPGPVSTRVGSEDLQSVWFVWAPGTLATGVLTTDGGTFLEVYSVPVPGSDPATVDWSSLTPVGGGRGTATLALRNGEAYAIRAYPINGGLPGYGQTLTWTVLTAGGGGGGGGTSFGDVLVTIPDVSDDGTVDSPDVIEVLVVDESPGAAIVITLDADPSALVTDTIDDDGTWFGSVVIPEGMSQDDHYVLVTIDSGRVGSAPFTVDNEVTYYDDPVDPADAAAPVIVDGQWELP